jgi:hypothetical protein
MRVIPETFSDKRDDYVWIRVPTLFCCQSWRRIIVTDAFVQQRCPSLPSLRHAILRKIAVVA